MKALKKNTVEAAAEVLLAKAEEQQLPFELISLDAGMGYRDVQNLSIPDLVSSIKQSGLLNPLIIWNGSPQDKGGMVRVEGSDPKPAAVLVAGRRRYEALRTLKRKEPKVFKGLFPNGVPCRVVKGAKADVLILKIVENLQRENPDGAEMMKDVITLRDDYNMKGAEIARKCGKTAAWVSSVIAIKEELGEEGVAAVASGEVSTRDAIKAARSVRKVGGAATAAGKATAKKTLGEAKAKTASNKAAGRTRSERRVSPEGVFKRYQAVASMNLTLAQRVVILEGALNYLAGKASKLPAELSQESALTDSSKTAAKGPGKPPAAAKKTLKPSTGKAVKKTVAKPAAKKVAAKKAAKKVAAAK